jgi:hypothetical protein
MASKDKELLAIMAAPDLKSVVLKQRDEQTDSRFF